MSRSKYIYMVYERDGDTKWIGTVKWEMAQWLKAQDHTGNFYAGRYRHGPTGAGTGNYFVPYTMLDLLT